MNSEDLKPLYDHLDKLGKRRPSFQIMLDHLLKEEFPPYILETGCMRQEDNYQGDGMSTLFWDTFCALHPEAGYLSLDINQDNVNFAKSKVTLPNNIICSDSVSYLHKNRMGLPAISVLYLDSYDLDPQNPIPSFLHCMKEFTAIKELLRPGAIICIDDNIPVEQDGQQIMISKGQFVRDYMTNVGILPYFEDYQIIYHWSW